MEGQEGHEWQEGHEGHEGQEGQEGHVHKLEFLLVFSTALGEGAFGDEVQSEMAKYLILGTSTIK